MFVTSGKNWLSLYHLVLAVWLEAITIIYIIYTAFSGNDPSLFYNSISTMTLKIYEISCLSVSEIEKFIFPSSHQSLLYCSFLFALNNFLRFNVYIQLAGQI